MKNYGKNTKIWFQKHVFALQSKQTVHSKLRFLFCLPQTTVKNEHVLTTLLFCCWIIASEEKDETQNGSKSSQMFCVWIIYFVSRSYLVQVNKPAKNITICHTPPFFYEFLLVTLDFHKKNDFFYLKFSIWDEETFSEPVKNVTHK